MGFHSIFLLIRTMALNKYLLTFYYFINDRISVIQHLFYFLFLEFLLIFSESIYLT